MSRLSSFDRIALALGALTSLAIPRVALAQTASNVVEVTTASATPTEVSSPPPASTTTTASATSTTLIGTPSSVAPVADGALDPEVVRRACRDATNIDWISWTFAGAYAATGAALTIYGALYPDPMNMPVPVGIAYMRGIGPGLILGAIGAPLARGVFATNDPLQVVCARMRQNEREHRDNTLDTYAADRVLRSIGAPPSFVMPLLIGLATAGCAVLTAIPFIVQDPGIASVAGGLSAAAIAAWVVLPPTPMQSASRAYVRGEYTARGRVRPGTIAVAPLGFTPGLAVVGTF